MLRLATLDFGKNKKLFGSDSRANGIETTQFLMQLDRKISESSAETYLDGSFIIFDAKKMSNEAKLIFAKNDIWQAFKFSDGGKGQAMDYERSMMMGMPVPPLPPNIPFVSRDEFFHAKDLAARAL